MKLVYGFGMVVVLSLSYSVCKVSSVPLNPDKLSLLDQHGYEVISGAEEFLTPVDNDNGLDLSEGEVSKPDILLYGKFYVLRRKGVGLNTNNMQDKIEDNSAAAETVLKKIPHSSHPHIMDRFLQLNPSSKDNHKNKHNDDNGNEDDDAILFPSDQEYTTKKYIRNRKPTQEGISSIPTTTVPLSEIFKSSQESKRSSPPGESDPDNLEDMTSDEVIDWVKTNLNYNDLTTVLDEGFGDRTLFHLPPRVKCPEGERKDPNGMCRKSYIHNVRTRMTRGNTKNKLKAVYESWKTLEDKAQEDLKESEKKFMEKAKTIFDDLHRKEKSILQTMSTLMSDSSTTQSTISDHEGTTDTTTLPS